MPYSKNIQIATQGDPRTLPEYASLHQEVSKLSHPARPDPDWKHIEALCLSLFRRNGLDLQSAAWFTLSLSYQYGSDGLRDGLKVTDALISACWSSLWPTHPGERAAIIQTLVKRLQTLIRTWSPEGPYALSSLYQCEKYLCLMKRSLREVDLKTDPGPDVLIALLRNLTGRLEQARKSAKPGRPDSNEDKHNAPSDSLPYPLVFIPPPAESKEAVSPPRASWSVKSFLSGAFLTLALVCVVGSGWYYSVKSDESTRLLASVVHSRPLPLTEDELEHIRRDPAVEPSGWINKIRKHTGVLDAAGIGRAGSHSADIAIMAAAVWPLEDVTDRLLSEMIARREVSAATPDEEGAWQKGMDTLNGLSDRLNALDEKRGRYLTVSELKTAVFASKQAFSLHIPAEEWLRRYQLSASSSEEAQFRRAMDELQARYDLIRIRRALNNQH